MKALCEAQQYNQPQRVATGLSEAIERRIKRYSDTLTGDTKKRKAATIEKWHNETLADCDAYIKLLDWYGVKMTASAKKVFAKLAGTTPEKAKDAANKAAALNAKAREKEQAEQARKNAELLALALPAWLAGNDNFDGPNGLRHSARQVLNYSNTVYLRVSGDNVETSKGAAFPIGHAVKAFAFIQTVMKRGEDWHKNGKTVHLGHFQLDSIAPNGDVKAGCHYVPYAEINRIAKLLGE